MYATKKLIPATIGVAGLALASMAAVGSAPASAVRHLSAQRRLDQGAQPSGRKRQRRDLRQAGTAATPVLQYVLNQKRNNIGTEVFQGTIDLKVFERDAQQRDSRRNDQQHPLRQQPW